MEQWEGSKRLELLTAALASETIKEQARFSGDSGRWTRERAMPLADMLRCILAKKGLTATMELRQYFQAAREGEEAVSKQDYLRQRQHLNPAVFKELNRIYLRQFYEGAEAETWQGMVVAAVDGSRVEIPDSAANRQKYGASENKYGQAVARANFSGMYDVHNHFFLDAGAHHFRSSEIEEAKAHVRELKAIVGERPVLLIFDRNYGSLEFINYLEKAGVKYLIRLTKWKYQAEVAGMRSADETVELLHTRVRLEHLKRTHRERYEELAREASTPARIIRMTFQNGEHGALLTNLTESGAWDIKQLYRKRWDVEQKYHTLKNKLKFESITGKASVYVEQDLLAQVLVFNMVQDAITGARWRAQQQRQRSKYRTRINENIAIGLYKERMIRLMLEEDDRKREELFARLKEDMMKNIVPIRTVPGKPRRWKYFNKYKCNQKPSF